MCGNPDLAIIAWPVARLVSVRRDPAIERIGLAVGGLSPARSLSVARIVRLPPRNTAATRMTHVAFGSITEIDFDFRPASFGRTVAGISAFRSRASFVVWSGVVCSRAGAAIGVSVLANSVSMMLVWRSDDLPSVRDQAVDAGRRETSSTTACLSKPGPRCGSESFTHSRSMTTWFLRRSRILVASEPSTPAQPTDPDGEGLWERRSGHT